MNVSAIIVAAGAGIRFGARIPKQFIALGGRPVFAWSLEVFERSSLINEMIVVVPPSDEVSAIEITRKWVHRVPVKVVPGGATRQESVQSGLDAVDADLEWVAVHDAARPLVTLTQIEAVCFLAQEVGAAILAIPVQDTVKVVDEDGLIIRSQDRTRLYLAQTPQVCRKEDLRSAYKLAEDKGIRATDEAGLLEVSGVAVGVAEGSPGNFKITTQEDLKMAEALITSIRTT
ncbi:MAG: 2-C-methyl-D-erythritol 4-phosphate cytidylyltransferase [Deltaproteobacteria bacterium]|nr:2-C-methyl-D-erythritol 4-phosphate cytidylyltransferase [Deltaproteobacteria bacterium]MDL1960870.1 2-C-methyl-D-erythritol 4-phosphate cytidylyltransferase [Deltaproteobacteria bacterium]